MQQEAARKLGFSASAHHAGRAAPLRRRRHRRRDRRPHHLYAYRRRADRPRRHHASARKAIGSDYGKRLRARRAAPAIKTKAKNAQEAHEAIRPTDLSPPPGDRCATGSITTSARLYELIWKRTIASQMEAAELERTTVDIDAKATRATSSCAPPARSSKFDGFLDALSGRPRRRRRRRGRRAACRR
ncbi:MAG: DNA topoisomerase [Rhodopseudomonas palustris]|nr:DNA topoisomerase [Rhodopseudomonas palustris]